MLVRAKDTVRQMVHRPDFSAAHLRAVEAITSLCIPNVLGTLSADWSDRVVWSQGEEGVATAPAD